MNNCQFTDNIKSIIRSNFFDVADRLYDLEELTNQEAKQELIKKIESYQQYTPQENTLAAIIEAAKACDLWGSPAFFDNEDEVKAYLTYSITENSFQSKENNKTDNDEILQISEDSDVRSKNTIAFLSETYGHASGIRRKAEKEVQVALVNSILVDRTPGQGELIDTNEKLNDKLFNYQEKLYKTVVDYLSQYYANPDLDASRIPNELSELQNTKMFKIIDGQQVYTGILPKLLFVAKKANLYLPKATRSEYRQWYDSLRTKSEEFIKAYNALTFLNHFDVYLDHLFGANIEFENFGNHGKYKLSDKGADNITNWTDEDTPVEYHIPKVVEQLVTTTPRYNYGSDNPMVIDGFNSYLSFADLSNTISKLKDIVFKPGDIIFNRQLLKGINLSNKTKSTISGQSLTSLINKIRLNPQKYLSAIMEIFSNGQLLNNMRELSPEIFSDILEEDQNIIYSMYKGLFSETGDSINALGNSTSENNYYSWLTQTCDSIFKIKFLQYYKNLKGETKLRDMRDFSKENLSRNIISTIQQKNCYNATKSQIDDSEFQIEFTGDGTIRQLKELSFPVKLDNYSITIKVGKDGTVSMFKPDGTTFVPTTEYTSLISWANEKLGIFADKHLFQLIAKNKNQTNKVMFDYISLAARTTMLQYVSRNLLYDKYHNRIKGRKAINNALSQIFGEASELNVLPTIDKSTKDICLVHNKDTYFIDDIAAAKAIEEGMYSNSQIKSGNGNSQSSYTLSRLLGSIPTQIEYQCKIDQAAMRNSFLVTHKDVFKGAFTAKEFYDLRNTKDHTEFTVGEMTHAQLMYDFIGGLCPNKGIIGNGTIALLPSVNSDKNTIGRILIDTTQIVPQFNKTIANLTPSEFQVFIAEELGTVYARTYQNIISDYTRLFDFLSKNDPLISGYKFNYVEYVSGFDTLNEFLIQKHIDPINYIKRAVREFNQINRQNPIHLIDQIHFCTGSKRNVNGSNYTLLAPNETLLGYLYRFEKGPFEHFATGYIGDEDAETIARDQANYNKIREIYNIKTDPRHGYVSNEQFWQIKSGEILKSLIDSRFKLDVSGKSSEKQYIQTILDPKNETGWNYGGKQWINPKTGKLILGYIGNVPITTKEDIQQLSNKLKPILLQKAQETNNEELIKKLSNPKYSLLTDASDLIAFSNENNVVTLNPIIEKYNYMDYLFTQEFMLATVGSCLAHPAKGDINSVLEEEAARFQAQHKRNVSFTASMQEFQLGTITGIPDKYNIAVIEDIKDLQYNIQGDIDDGIKPYDGATFVNPFIVYLENNSLGGAKAGITKKQFVHYYDHLTGTGGIIKTAGFGLTNDWIQNSAMMERLMRKMTSRTWLDNHGNEYFTDFTKNYKEEYIGFDDIYFKSQVDQQYYKINRYEPILDENGNYTNQYKVYGTKLNVTRKAGKLGATFNGVEGNSIDITESAFGSSIITINSNYTLWNAFGGKNSLELNGNQLIPSENSIKNVVKAMNQIGITNDPNNIQTQDDLYQPLKHSDVHYLATAGAVKQGAANINSRKSYYDDTPFDFMIIHMNQAGIQLDKEHHADGSELSLMTQVISACAHLGYTQSEANRIYFALRSLTDQCTSDLLEPFKNFIKGKGNTTEEQEENLHNIFKTAVINTVLKIMSKEQVDESSLLNILTSELMEKVDQGYDITWNDLEGKIPVDNNAIYGQFLSKIHNYLTNSGIKMKIPGILSVLTPSYGSTKFYNGEKREAIEHNIEGITFNEKLQQIQDTLPEIVEQSIENQQDNQLIAEIEEARNARSERFLRARTHDQKLKAIEEIYGMSAQEVEDLQFGDIYAYVASNITQHSLKRGNSDHSKGFYAELGVRSKDLKPLSSLFHETDGKTPDQFAHMLWENQPSGQNWSTEELKNTLIDLVYYAQSPDDIRNYSVNQTINQLEKAKQAEENDYIHRYSVAPTIKTTLHLEHLKLGRWYQVAYNDGSEELINVSDPIVRYELRQKLLNGEFTSCREYILPHKDNPDGGNDLASYDLTFVGTIKPTLNQLVITGNSRTTAEKAAEIGGIDTLRHPDANGMHFGNPFSHNSKWGIVTGNGTVQDAVIAFEQWLRGTNYQNVEPVRRQWILDQINSGNLDNKPLVYYTNSVEINGVNQTYDYNTNPNHAHILQKLIYEHKLQNNTKYNHYSIWDFDSTQALFKLKPILDDYKSKVKKLGKLKNEEYYAKLKEATTEYKNKLINLALSYQHILPQTLNGQSLDYTKITNLDSYAKFLELNFRKKVRQDTAAVSQSGKKFYKQFNLYIDGELVTPDESTIKISPYELMLPKIYINEFGLDKYDSVNDILNDEQFFTNKILQNFGSKISHESLYDIELKRTDGKHIYILNESQLKDVKKGALEEIFFKKRITDKKGEDGKTSVEWIDRNNEVICEMANATDKVFRDINTGTQIIVTTNPEFYLINSNYNTIHISEKYNPETGYRKEDVCIKQFDAQMKAIKNASHFNKSAKRFYDFIYSESKIEGVSQKSGQVDKFRRFFLNAQLSGKNLTIANLQNTHNAVFDMIHKAGKEIMTSFKQSLNVVASRTPSQSMQSFMPMRIVAFDNPNINTAFVNTAQIWLQGSDYDIDAVSIAAFAINKDGTLPLWSPYASLASDQDLKDSFEMEFPSGQKIQTHAFEDTKDFKNKSYIWAISLLRKYIGSDKLFTLVKKEGKITLIRQNNVKLTNQLIKDLKEAYELNPQVLTVICNGTRQIAPFRINDTHPAFTHEDITNMINDMIKVVDRHNLYFKKLGRHKIETIAKNYSMYHMFKISQDPINLIQSQSSVDAMTGPAKKIGNSSPSAKIVTTRTPGNFINKSESIVENQVGKEAIGICAVGMKAFFGLTAYNNQVLESGNIERIKMLKLDHSEGIRIGNKTYTHIANINPSAKLIDELDEIINQNESSHIKKQYSDLKNQLINAKNQEDAALTLSAMLSLATDNAKELQLSKLNAGTKTIGMYLYGISIGMNIKEISEILMSDVGYTVTELMEGNTFDEEFGAKDLQSVFDILEIGPKKALRKFKKSEMSENQKILSPAMQMNQYLVQQKHYSYAFDLATNLARLAWSNDESLEDKFNLIDSMHYTGSDPNFIYLFGQLQDFAKHYVNLVHNLKTEENGIIKESHYYKDLKTLSQGAQEMRVLGSILSLNQGLKSKSEELMAKILNFTSCISDRQNDAKREALRINWRQYYMTGNDNMPGLKSQIKENLNRFNLIDFINDPVYRNQIISEYDKIKHTFNILDCVTSVPHFDGYFQTLGLAFASDYYTSPKFRFTFDVGNYWIEKLNIKSSKDKQKVYKGAQQYYSDYVRQRWMIDQNIQFTLPAGCNMIVENVNASATTPFEYVAGIVPVTEPTPIKLGTRTGDATFKLFMEQYFIPKLQKGEYKHPGIINNKFIKNLSPAVFTHTVTHNPILYYTLPINMMPRTDIEQSIFDNYKASLNDLSSVKLNDDIPLSDLFFYYGLIAHYGKPGQQSLMPIFQNLHKSGQLEKFHEYESQFNEEIPTSNIQEYVVPLGNLYDSYYEFIYAEDPDSMLTLLYERDFDEETGSNYAPVRNQIITNEDVSNFTMYGNLNDVATRIYNIRLSKDQSDFVEFHLNGNRIDKIIHHHGATNTQIQQDITTKVLDMIKIIANSSKPSGFKEGQIPKHKVNGQIVDDTDKIMKLINKIINCG